MPKSASVRPPANYLALVRQCPLRPIRSEAALDAAQAMIDRLTGRNDLDEAEQDYLDVLTDLVERYEAQAHAVGDVNEADMLRFLIDQHGVTQVEVARGAAISESTVSEVLSGKRQLTRRQIAKLAGFFRVTPAVFLAADQAP